MNPYGLPLTTFDLLVAVLFFALILLAGVTYVYLFRRVIGLQTPWKFLLTGMLFAGFVGEGIAGPVEWSLTSWFGWSYVALVLVGAPLIEEPCKAFWAILCRRKFVLSHSLAFNGLASGAGFGAFENFNYAWIAYLLWGLPAALGLFIIRSLLTMPFHAATATLTGWGVSKGWMVFSVTLLIAMCLHYILNFLAIFDFALAQTWTSLAVVAASFVGLDMSFNAWKRLKAHHASPS